jgi:glycosyltransferase involved in cell wall biosynthesis
LMVTRGKLFPGRHAIACFQRQVYPNRELVVVVDDPACELIAHISSLNDDKIRLVRLSADRKTLGELRNISVAEARGEYVCQWDDDDLYDPERIQTQLGALLASGAAACLLRRWTIWWPEAKKLAISGSRLWEGSILGRKSAMPGYPAWRRGEDTAMVDELVQRCRVLSLDAPELYTYIHHGNNTFGQQHFVEIYNYSKRHWIGARYHERFEQLAARLPIRDYLTDLDLPTGAGIAKIPYPPPLVSIIVRSMGRPELRLALESLAEQDYPALDVIVVDATGGSHPPLPEISWRAGHAIRMASRNRRLPRPQAANVGLDEVRGEWFGFLDDDDTFDADHVSQLMAVAVTTANKVVYGMTRMLGTNEEVKGISGRAFNRAIMFYGPLFYFPAALVGRDVIRLGCRFDEQMEIGEDRDFFAQIAALSDFTKIDLATFNYHVELGTSGTGQGGNQNVCQSQRFEQLLRAKWFGSGTYHSERSLRLNRRAFAAYYRGEPDTAMRLFEAALHEYPDDPNALNGLGRLMSEAGELETAETMLRLAVQILPDAGEYRLSLAAHLERAGNIPAARKEAWAATASPTTRTAAQQILMRLGGPPAQPKVTVSTAFQSSVTPSRMAPCPCGSGKRYKHCCGQLTGPAASENATDSAARRAVAAFKAGEAYAALEMLADVAPEGLTHAETTLACADLCQQLERHEQAYTFCRQAAVLGETNRAAEHVARLCNVWYRSERRASMRRTLTQQIDRFKARQKSPFEPLPVEPKHIIGAFDKVGGSEHCAFGLYETLSRHTSVRLWSTVPPIPEYEQRYPITTIDVAQGQFPRSGHLIFVGAYFDYGDWLNQTRPGRITISVNIDLFHALIARLVQLEEIPSAFSLDLTFPSNYFRNIADLPGVVEYPPIDTQRFRATRFKTEQDGPLIIGRHSRDDRLKFHPNDPAFFRQLARDGHQVKIDCSRIFYGRNLVLT